MNLPNEINKRDKTGFVIPYKYLYELVTNKKIASSKILKEWTILNYSKYLNNEK